MSLEKQQSRIESSITHPYPSSHESEKHDTAEVNQPSDWLCDGPVKYQNKPDDLKSYSTLLKYEILA